MTTLTESLPDFLGIARVDHILPSTPKQITRVELLQGRPELSDIEEG